MKGIKVKAFCCLLGLVICGCQPSYMSDQEILQYEQVFEPQLGDNHKKYLTRDVIKRGQKKGDKVHLDYTFVPPQCVNKIVESQRLKITLSTGGAILNVEERKIKSVTSGIERDVIEDYLTSQTKPRK